MKKTSRQILLSLGCGLISPSDPEGFVIPDLATTYVEIDRKKTLQTRRKEMSESRQRLNFR